MHLIRLHNVWQCITIKAKKDTCMIPMLVYVLAYAAINQCVPLNAHKFLTVLAF